MEVLRIAEKYDLIVISDEIYDQLVYGDHQHVCFSTLPGAWDRTLLLGGFSKDYAMTGWRIGFAAGPAELIRGLVRIHQYNHHVRPDHRPGSRRDRPQGRPPLCGGNGR